MPWRVKIPIRAVGVKVGQLIRHRAMCPLCQGNQRLVTPAFRRQDPRCHLCKGKGWIPTRVCFQCGRPDYLEVMPLGCCGADVCIKSVQQETVLRDRATAVLIY